MASTTNPNAKRDHNSIAEFCARAENTLRTGHYSPRTTKSYVYWNWKFLRDFWFSEPDDLREKEVTAFLSGLALRE